MLYTLKDGETILAESDNSIAWMPKKKCWDINNGQYGIADPDQSFTLVGPGRQEVSRIEFKLLFTLTERIAITTARAYDGADAGEKMKKLILDELFSVIEDPDLKSITLTHASVVEGLDYLESEGLIGAGRSAAIQNGIYY